MASISPQIANEVRSLKSEATARDKRMELVGKVRDGEIHEIWPSHFSAMYPQSMVANFIDSVARDLSEVIAPLPTLNCSSGAMKSQADKRRAERKNRIGENVWRHSRLSVEMFYGTDRYLTYGFLPLRVEADYECRRPMMMLDDPCGAYYRLDRWGCTVRYARVWRENTTSLAAKWPEYAHLIAPVGETGTDTEVVCYEDATNVTMYLPEREGLILDSYKHGMSRCPVVVAERPGLRKDPRGQFDDVLWVQLARAEMAALTLQAGHEAVEAPITVPTDMTDIPLGPGAVWQTDRGSEVGRVKMDVPNAAFALGAQLNEELKIGSRYPDGRLGIAEASVITGKGVQALMGGFDTQIKTAQTILGEMLRMGTELALEMDEALWPNKVEKITGTISGRSYEMTYTPRVDIAGNYSCDVTYGFASGMSPQNAIVTMLQARGDGLIDRDTVRRQLPWQLDAEQVQRDLDVQETEDALKQGLFASLQASGQMMANGMTDEAMMFFAAAADLIKGRENGKPLADVLVQAFEDFQQKQQEKAQAAQQAQAAAGGGAAGPGGIPGSSDTGLPDGVAPGQAGMPPGGLRDVQSLIAGFRGGNAQMDSSVRRRIPTG